jgi:hypothetical protein
MFNADPDEREAGNSKCKMQNAKDDVPRETRTAFAF